MKPDGAATMYWRERLRSIPTGIVLLFALLCAGLGTAGRIYYLREEREFKQAAGSQLSTIAEMKVMQVLRWRRERIQDVELLRRGPIIANTVTSLALGHAPVGLPPRAADFLALFQKYQGYEELVGLDRRGVERFSLPGGARKVDSQCAAAAAEALRTGGVVFSDLHRVEGDPKV